MQVPLMQVIDSVPSAKARGRIPLWLKLLYSMFVAVLVPWYWASYGPTNFLYFCDVALLLTLLALWREDSLLASMSTVGILLPQILWMLDFLSTAAGIPLVGMTGYMFDPSLSLFTRGLSFFHFWLPLVLIWTVWRLGYDSRALPSWTCVAWGLLLVCYFLMPAPPAPMDDPALPVNINYVYGLNDRHPQTWMRPNVWFGLMLVALPVGIFLPTHLVMRRVFPAAAGDGRMPCTIDSTGRPGFRDEPR